MARARNIKPGFYKNEDLAECSLWARFIFPGLWMLADREGRLEDRPKRIKGELLPFDSVEVEPLLEELTLMHFIERYEADGIKVIQVLKFSTHQAPHYSEKASELPAKAEADKSGTPETRGDDGIETPGNSSLHERETPGELRENSGSNPAIKRGSQPPDSLIPDSLIPDSLQQLSAPSVPPELPFAEQQQVRANGKLERLACPIELLVAAYHEAMPNNPRCKVLNQSRRTAIGARWREASKLVAFPFAGGYQTQSEGLEKWQKFFAVCNESSFLTGQSIPTQGRPPFFADIDFLMSPKGFAKTLENHYHREAA